MDLFIILLNCVNFLNDLNNTLFLRARERTVEVEREIERQRLLEVERAKTRELRHNLDMDKEKQTQARRKYHD